MSTWKIEQAELVEWLQKYEGPRFHAIVSDPPYALISIGKRFGKAASAPAQEGTDGRFSRLSKGFMGQSWDGFETLDHYREWVATWAKLLIEKALEPGAVCLFFGGTRTWHHLALGLEQGGFEVYDTIVWLYGSGFPKSHNIGKSTGMNDWNGHGTSLKPAFEPILLCRSPRSGNTYAQLAVEHGSGALNIRATRVSSSAFDQKDGLFSISLDIVQDAVARIVAELRTYSNIGTFLLRDADDQDDISTSDAEYDEMLLHRLFPNGVWCGQNLNTIQDFPGDCLSCRHSGDELLHRVQEAAQLGPQQLSDVLVDICQELISHIHSPYCQCSDRPSNYGVLYRVAALAELLSGYPIINVQRPEGRWPANLILSHHEDCIRIGEAEVPGYVINRWKEGMKPFSEGAGGEYETVHPTRAGELSANNTYENEGSTDFAMKPGARRESEMELIERWACVSECSVRQLDNQAGHLKSGTNAIRRREGSFLFHDGLGHDGDIQTTYGDAGGPSRFFYTGKSTRGEKDLGLDDFYWKRVDTGFERVDKKTWQKLPRRERARGCIHPTVKPLEIVRYLATLVLPPKQETITRRILVPFSGSGSEIIGAIQAGWDEVVGIEMEVKYNEMAEARLRAAIGMF